MKVLSVLRTSAGVDEYPILRALMASRCELTNLDDRIYGFHHTPNRFSWVERRINRAAYIASFNSDLTRYINLQRPDLLILFKAAHVKPQTIEYAKNVGCHTLCVYPDLDPRVLGENYIRMLRTVDELYFTKPNLIENFRSCIRQDAKLLYPLYSKLEISEIESVDESIGVSFVGHYSPKKEQSIKEFLTYYDGKVTVVGDGWGALQDNIPHSLINVYSALYGNAIQMIYRRSICTLGLLMEPLPGGWPGDEITSRSVLVPTSGGVLLHPRNTTSEWLYGRDSGLLYSTAREAAEIALKLAKDGGIRLRLAHEQKQKVLAHASCAEDLVENWIK